MQGGEGVGFVERIDAQNIIPNWFSPSFDDSSWTAAALVGPHPVQPWTGPLLPDLTRITETERLVVIFRRAVRHDKLGVNESLVNIQMAWEKKRITGAGQFLPLLDQVAKNDTYMHMARERAAQLGDAIRAKSKAE